MAITYVGSAQGTTTVTIPTHQVGDLIVIYAFRDNATETIPSLGSGFTSLDTLTGTINVAHRVGYTFAQTTSTTSGTWTNATTVVCMVYRGVAGIGTTVVQDQGTSATISYSALTMTNDGGGSWVVGFAGHRSITGGAGFVAPSGYTRRILSADGTDSAIGFDSNGGVTTAGATTGATGLASSNYTSFRMELLPKPDAPVLSRYTQGTGSVTFDIGPAETGKKLAIIARFIDDDPSLGRQLSLSLNADYGINWSIFDRRFVTGTEQLSILIKTADDSHSSLTLDDFSGIIDTGSVEIIGVWKLPSGHDHNNSVAYRWGGTDTTISTPFHAVDGSRLMIACRGDNYSVSTGMTVADKFYNGDFRQDFSYLDVTFDGWSNGDLSATGELEAYFVISAPDTLNLWPEDLDNLVYDEDERVIDATFWTSAPAGFSTWDCSGASSNYDDVSHYVEFPWPFPFAGRWWSGCYLSDNGYITFGAGSTVYNGFDVGVPAFSMRFGGVDHQMWDSTTAAFYGMEEGTNAFLIRLQKYDHGAGTGDQSDPDTQLVQEIRFWWNGIVEASINGPGSNIPDYNDAYQWCGDNEYLDGFKDTDTILRLDAVTRFSIVYAIEDTTGYSWSQQRGRAIPYVTPKLEELTADFDIDEYDNAWSEYSPAAEVVLDGTLRISASMAYPAIYNWSGWDLLESSAFIRLVSHPGSATGSVDAIFAITLDRESGDDHYQYFWHIGNDPLTIQAGYRDGSTTNQWIGTSISYNPSVHQFFRIRHSSSGGDTIYWDTSEDGVTWTNRYTRSLLGFGHEDVMPKIYAGDWNSDSYAVVIWDNFNYITPDQTAVWDATTAGNDVTIYDDGFTVTRYDAVESYAAAITNLTHTVGKHYFEIFATNVMGSGIGTNFGIGVAVPTVDTNEPLTLLSDATVLQGDGWVKDQNNDITNVSMPILMAVYVRVAVDMDNQKIWWFVEGDSGWHDGDPATNTGGTSISNYTEVAAYIGMDAIDQRGIANFGQEAFWSAPPTGFTAWNIPDVVGAPYTLDADYTAYFVTSPSDAGTLRGLKVVSDRGQYSLSALTTTRTLHGRKVVSDRGLYSLSALTTTRTLYNRNAVAAQGSFAETGQAAALKRGLKTSAAYGAYVYTGQPIEGIKLSAPGVTRRRTLRMSWT